MRVLIAGAGGAIGLPVVRALVERGHVVAGVVRSPESARRVEAAGGRPHPADVLDRHDVDRVVAATRPDVVVDQLTALPRTYSPEAMRESLSATTRVRVDGGDALYAAALAHGCGRYVVQSGCYYYAAGDGTAQESVPFTDAGGPLVQGNVAAFRHVEDRALGGAMAGVVLRYGFFYGPGTWYSPDGDMGTKARVGELPIYGDGTAVWPFVHVDDAATATVEAAVGRDVTGVFNVTEDAPLPAAEWTRRFARHVGGPEPAVVPLGEPPDADALFYAQQMRGASNAAAKDALLFRPRASEWR